MATLDMALIIGGRVIPNFSDLVEVTEPNETDNVTLGGTLYTDFINTRRAWQHTWEKIKASDFAVIRELINSQYTNERYHVMQFNAYDIYTPVKLNINEKTIRYNGSIIENVTLTIKEQYAFS